MVSMNLNSLGISLSAAIFSLIIPGLLPKAAANTSIEADILQGYMCVTGDSEVSFRGNFDYLETHSNANYTMSGTFGVLNSSDGSSECSGKLVKSSFTLKRVPPGKHLFIDNVKFDSLCISGSTATGIIQSSDINKLAVYRGKEYSSEDIYFRDVRLGSIDVGADLDPSELTDFPCRKDRLFQVHVEKIGSEVLISGPEQIVSKIRFVSSAQLEVIKTQPAEVQRPEGVRIDNIDPGTISF